MAAPALSAFVSALAAAVLGGFDDVAGEPAGVVDDAQRQQCHAGEEHPALRTTGRRRLCLRVAPARRGGVRIVLVPTRACVRNCWCLYAEERLPRRRSEPRAAATTSEILARTVVHRPGDGFWQASTGAGLILAVAFRDS